MFLRTLVALAVAGALQPTPAVGAILIMTPDSVLGTDSPAQPRISDGLAALNAGDHETAEKAFKAAIAADKRAAAAYLGLAEVAGRRGDDAGVEEWLRKGQTAAPTDVGLLHSAGAWHARKGRHAEAERLLLAAVKLVPTSPSIQSTLAELYLSKRSTVAKAEAAFRTALAADPAYTPAKVGLARSLAGRGKSDEAREVLIAAARAAPTDPMPVHALARLEAGQSRLDEAMKQHQRVIAIAPDYAPAYLDLGDLHLVRGNLDEGIATYRAGVAAVKDPTPLIFRMGVAFEAAQRWDDAERAYLDVVTRDPKVFGAYNNLAFMSATRKVKLDKALEWAQQARKSAPGVASVIDTLGWVHWARGEYPQALKALQEAARLSPRDPVVQHHLGVVYADLGRKADATAAFKRALALDPRFKHAADARQRLQQLGSS